MAETRPDPQDTDDDVVQATARQRFWRAVDRIHTRNSVRVAEDEMEFITQIVDEARQERHDATQRNTKGRC